MKRSALLVSLLLLPATTFLPVAADPPTWRSTMALGPTDATALAARPGLLLAGGNKLTKSTIGVIPGPRTTGFYRSTDRGRTWSLGEQVIEDDVRVPVTEVPDTLAVSGDDAYATVRTDVWRGDAAAVTWARVGALPSSASTLDVMPSGHLLAGLAAGGLRISSDRGQTWQPFGSGLPASRVNQVAFFFGPDSTLVATDAGLYRSTDGGSTFAQVTSGILSPSSAALAVTFTPSFAFLAMPASPQGSLIYTSVNGADWTIRAPVYSQNLLPRVNPGGLRLVVQASQYVLFAGTDRGLFRLEGGAAATAVWLRLDPEPGFRSVGVMAAEDLDPGPLRNHIVYASVQRASVYAYATTERGFTAPGWYDELEGGRVCGGFVARADGRVFAACGRHVLVSADGGATWKHSGNGLPYVTVGLGDVPHFPLVQGADGSLWTSCFYCGLYHSMATGDVWNKVATFPAASVTAMGASPTDPNVVLAAGLPTNGSTPDVLYRTTDGGTTWRPVLEPGTSVTTVVFSKLAPPTVLVGTNSAGLWRSTDAGATWVRVDLPAGATSLSTAFSQAKAGLVFGSTLLSGAINLFRSEDGGATWTHVGPVSPTAFSPPRPSPWDESTVYFTTSSSGPIVTRDGGQTYEAFRDGLPGSAPYATNIGFSPTQAGVLYVTSGVLGTGSEAPDMWVFRAAEQVA